MNVALLDAESSATTPKAKTHCSCYCYSCFINSYEVWKMLICWRKWMHACITLGLTPVYTDVRLCYPGSSHLPCSVLRAGYTLPLSFSHPSFRLYCHGHSRTMTKVCQAWTRLHSTSQIDMNHIDFFLVLFDGLNNITVSVLAIA